MRQAFLSGVSLTWKTSSVKLRICYLIRLCTYDYKSSDKQLYPIMEIQNCQEELGVFDGRSF